MFRLYCLSSRLNDHWCTSTQDEPRNDYRPIPNTEHQAEQKVNRPTSAQYYQSVLDDARKYVLDTAVVLHSTQPAIFIANSLTRRPPGDLKPLILKKSGTIIATVYGFLIYVVLLYCFVLPLCRTRLDNVSIDTKKYEVAGGNQAVGCTDATSQNIIENLSRPVSVYNIDIVADEMAEIIAKHTTELNIDDSASSIASFKAAPSVSTA